MARRWQKPGGNRRAAVAGLLLVLIAFGSTGAATFGARTGLWTAEKAVTVLPWAMVFAALGLLVSLVTRFSHGRTGNGLSVLTVLLALVFLGTSGMDAWRVRQAPGLKDVTTNLVDPPAAGSAARPDLHRAIDHGKRPGFAMLTPDEKWRAIHADAYPELKGVTLPLAPAAALERARKAALDSGWDVLEVGKDTIEARATSLLFGFPDLVIIRVRGQGQGSRVDVRSIRQQGPDDRGQGVRNIAKFFAHLKG